MSLRENYFLTAKRDYSIPSWVEYPRISLLLPVYNHKSYLKESLSSVLAQEVENLTVQILDDGSTDSPFDELGSLLNDPRVHFTRQENQGLPTALNNLKSSIRGKADFITWHSADNLYSEKNCLNILSQFLSANPDLALTYANTQIIEENGEKSTKYNYRLLDQKNDPKNSNYLDLNYSGQTLSLYNDNFINACFLSRARIEEFVCPYKKEALGFEDYLNWLNINLFDEISHIGLTNPMYYYRLHEESLTANLDNKKFKDLQSKYFSLFNFLTSSVKTKNLNLEKEKSSLTLKFKQKPKNFSTEINPVKINYLASSSLIHQGHLYRQKVEPLIINGQNYHLRPGIDLDILMTRARSRDLGLFGSDHKEGRLLLFCPDINSNLEKFNLSQQALASNIGQFVKSHQNIGIVLVVENEGELEFSKLVHLSSDLSPNLRIISTLNEQLNKEISYRPLALLNSLGSVDAVISIANFLPSVIDNVELFPSTDISNELALSASVSRPLLAPSFIRNYLGVFPNHFSLSNLNLLPINLASLKVELSENNCDSIVRYFSEGSANNERIAFLISELINGVTF